MPVTPNSPPRPLTVRRKLSNQPAVSAPRVPSLKQISKETPSPGSTTRLRASPRLKHLYDRLNHHRSPHLAQSVQHDPTIAGKMFDPTTGHAETIDTLLSGPDALIWTTSLANEWGRSTSGLSKHRTAKTSIKGNNTMVFIKPHQVLHGRKVTYANFVCTMRPGKS